MNRAFSTQVFLRAVGENPDARIIEGVATTGSEDRLGDYVLPMGAKYALPIPLLWMHDAARPIGEVIKAGVDEKGVAFRAKLAHIEEDGALKARLEEAWQSIKAGLTKAVSIGFRPIEMEPRKDGKGGMIFREWEWLELSVCSIPANADAAILNIKAYDEEQRRLHLPKAHVVRLDRPIRAPGA
ncbi:HK97 family phage prohead protease [Paraburkholderia sp. SIMBA_049]